MFNRIRQFLLIIISFFSCFMGNKPVYGNLVSYGDAVKTGVFDQIINIDYQDEIYANKKLYQPLYYLIDMASDEGAGSSTVKGYDETKFKDILNTSANFTSQTTGQEGNALVLTMAANEKNNLIVNQAIEIDCTPDATHTNIVYVYDKVTSDTTTIQVKAVDPTLLIGTTNSTVVASGTVLNTLASVFEQNSGSVKPISTFPTTIENYQQEMKFPYEYSNVAAKENLYTKGTLRNKLDDDAKKFFSRLREKALLFNGRKYKKSVASSTDTVEKGYAQGIIYWVRTGGGPAVKTYSTWSLNVFDDWQYKLFDPELDDPAQRRMLLVNKAFRKFFTDTKTTRQGWVETKEETYGLEGIKTIETDGGVFDVMVHPLINARWPDKDKPVGLAVYLPHLHLKEMEHMYLAANIQNNDVTGKKSEYRCTTSWLLNNAGTAYHGWIAPQS